MSLLFSALRTQMQHGLETGYFPDDNISSLQMAQDVGSESLLILGEGGGANCSAHPSNRFGEFLSRAYSLPIHGVDHLDVDLQLIQGEQHPVSAVGPPAQINQVNLRKTVRILFFILFTSIPPTKQIIIHFSSSEWVKKLFFLPHRSP